MQDQLPLSETDAYQPFECIPGDPGATLVLLADHATNIVPEPYGISVYRRKPSPGISPMTSASSA